MSKLFGGSKSKSKQESYNKAYPQVSQQLSPLLPYAQQGASQYSAFLNGDTSGFEKYLDNTGYDFQQDEGQRGILQLLGNKGLRNSGAALRKLTRFNTDLKQQYSNNYLDRLLGLANVGTDAARTITGAGGYSLGASSSKTNPGLGSFIGQIAGGIAAGSDRRLKKDIEYIKTLDNGLNVYRFMYINDKGPYIGVMADEVAEIMPEALGPVIDGYATVNYDMIEGIRD